MPSKQTAGASAQDGDSTSTTHVAPSRPGKRVNPATGAGGPGSGKRRMAYAPRACDSCRRRKGKCDGNSPCEYCLGRGQACNYSLTSSDWRSVLGNVPPSQSSSNAPFNHVGHMMMSLQSKLDSLTSLIEQQQSRGNDRASAARDASGAERSPGSVVDHSPEAQSTLFSRQEKTTSSPKQRNASSDAGSSSHAASNTTGIRFFGHMSPDYSFHMARNRLLRDTDGTRDRVARLSIPGIDQDLASGLGRLETGLRASSVAGLSFPTFNSLVEVPLRMTLDEALRLVDVYDQIVGQRNPFVEMTVLKEQTTRWYEWAAEVVDKINGTPRPCPVDENDSLILLLVISIALAAETSSARTDTCEQIYTRVEESIKMKLVSPVTNMRDIIIILLSAHYHYFRGTSRASWRLCGVAGSMLMELGLHNGEVLRHVLESEKEREVAAVISATLLTLDHQYSAMMGLPTHHKVSSFPPELLSPVRTPYLRAMIPFLRISEMVSATILNAIQSGSYDDDEAFELANFQIEQWRRKSLSDHAPILLERPYCSDDQIPSWSLLIYLRANSVKNMLFRPLFFSTGRRMAAERQIKPALDLITDSVETLVQLDKGTAFYRNQHAHFQHMLSGACALLFLVLAYIADTENSELARTIQCEQPDVADKIMQVYNSSVALSQAYSSVSAAAETLLWRLNAMTPILDRLRTVSNEIHPAGSVNGTKPQEPPVAEMLQSSETTEQRPLPPKAILQVSPPTEGTNQPQMPLHDTNAFLMPNIIEQGSWPDQPLSTSNPNSISVNQPFNYDSMMAFGGVANTPANMSMMRWLMTNGESMVQPLPQWSFHADDDLFNTWNNS
ncbi:hypothetical protein CERZMDRAFT_97305 [Cercospora zeae-maydis SCOH1-5]|uniref:Zn(2)-C6 fungal-type domain-containing protein n=1 Tax=Cercospora zeae-maydis SCOH1-5 TaxID=717836 RepID=A0A6A6FH74_9PEZI|nr:hypothetical protein CERZMDRAFT_97305 [Cercospora zeae-maydis SCOH1-5]